MASIEQLFAAIEAGDVDGVSEMVMGDPPLAAARDAEGVSALMRARYRFDRGLVRAIMAGGLVLDAFEAAAFADLDPNAPQSGGWTPLHSAAYNGNAELAGLLLDHDADPAAVNDDGATVLALAEDEGDADAIALIRQALG